MEEKNKLPERGTDKKPETDKRIGIAKGKFKVPADFDEMDFDTEKLFESEEDELLSELDKGIDDFENERFTPHNEAMKEVLEHYRNYVVNDIKDNTTTPLITVIPIFIPEKNTIIPCSVKIQKEENWFVATDFETGVAPQGKTLEKALLNIGIKIDPDEIIAEVEVPLKQEPIDITLPTTQEDEENPMEKKYEAYLTDENRVYEKDGRVFYKIIDKKRLPIRDGMVIITIPEAVFAGKYQQKVIDENGKTFSLGLPAFIRFQKESPQWYWETVTVEVLGIHELQEIGDYIALL